MTLFCPACLTSVFKTKILKKGHACNENGDSDGASDPFIQIWNITHYLTPHQEALFKHVKAKL